MAWGDPVRNCGGLGQPRCGGALDNILNGIYTSGDVMIGGVFSPSNPSSSQYPIKINTNTGGAGGVSGGQTTLDKLLATLTSIYALNQHAGYVPTTAIPAQAQYSQGVGSLSVTDQAAIDAYTRRNSGGQFGQNLQEFVQNNTGVLLIGGVMVVLLFLKPPTRRNGIRKRRRARR